MAVLFYAEAERVNVKLNCIHLQGKVYSSLFLYKIANYAMCYHCFVSCNRSI